MPVIRVNGIDIAYDRHGRVGNPVVCLIQGLGVPSSGWPPEMIETLTRRDLEVLTFDNRDIGQSQLLTQHGVPNLSAMVLKRILFLPLKAPYSLMDMMRDTQGLLQALNISRAHMLGVSTGGMIAQLLAIHAPDSVASLTSIMSNTGSRFLPLPRRDVMKHFLSKQRAGQLSYNLKSWQLLQSPAYPRSDEDWMRFIQNNFKRGITGGGVARQMAAVVASRNRTRQLKKLKTPSLVIHGSDDPLLPLKCGLATAKAIPGARLQVYPGMGHDLPPELIEKIMARVSSHIMAAESAL